MYETPHDISLLRSLDNFGMAPNPRLTPGATDMSRPTALLFLASPKTGYPKYLFSHKNKFSSDHN